MDDAPTRRRLLASAPAGALGTFSLDPDAAGVEAAAAGGPPGSPLEYPTAGPLAGLVAAMALLASGCVSPPPTHREAPGPAAPDRVLTWADEFEAETLDRESWTVEVMPDPHNEELQYYTGRADGEPGANVRIEDGVLVIEARREDFEHRRYTSARINTRGKREFLYGRFEARIRQPGDTGMWPAFWLLGANIGDAGWPACGEIDVVEGKGRFPTWTSGAIHAGPDPDGNRIVSFSTLLERGDVQSSWRVFAVEWEPAEIRWFVDGERVFRVRKPAAEHPVYWPFDHGHPFYLILNLAVGGWFDPGHPPPEDMSPQRLLVDWVRVYQTGPRRQLSAHQPAAERHPGASPVPSSPSTST